MNNEEMDPEAKILGQIANPQMKRADIALSYASCIRQRGSIDWPKVNRAITDRWSLSGLSYIKGLAWKEL